MVRKVIAAVASAFSMADSKARGWWNVPLSTATSPDVFSFGGSMTTNGTASRDTSTETARNTLSYASAATTGSRAGAHDGAAAGNFGSLPILQWHIRTGASVAVVRIAVGFGPGGTTIIDNDTTVSDSAYFRFSTAAGDSNWKCCTADGTTQTIVDSGVAVTAATNYVLRIDCSTLGTTKFYINGVLVVSTTTTTPTAADLYNVTCELATLENVAKTLKIGGGYHERNR